MVTQKGTSVPRRALEANYAPKCTLDPEQKLTCHSLLRHCLNTHGPHQGKHSPFSLFTVVVLHTTEHTAVHRQGQVPVSHLSQHSSTNQCTTLLQVCFCLNTSYLIAIVASLDSIHGQQHRNSCLNSTPHLSFTIPQEFQSLPRRQEYYDKRVYLAKSRSVALGK